MANTMKLNAAVDQLRDLEEKVSVFEDGQEKQAKVNRYLRAKVDYLQEKLDAVTDRIQFLESVLELEDLVEQEPGGGTEGEAGGAGQSADRVPADREASRVSNGIEEADGMKVSQELAKSKVVKVRTIDLDVYASTDTSLGCGQRVIQTSHGREKTRCRQLAWFPVWYGYCCLPKRHNWEPTRVIRLEART